MRNARNKYGAVKTEVDGIKFDSKAEARRYSELRLLQKANAISSIQVHPRYPIYVKEFRVCDVVLDFAYTRFRDNQPIHEDVKGRDNALSKLKRKMVEAYYGIKVEVLNR